MFSLVPVKNGQQNINLLDMPECKTFPAPFWLSWMNCELKLADREISLTAQCFTSALMMLGRDGLEGQIGPLRSGVGRLTEQRLGQSRGY